ncbi:hypothetical protein PIB30_013498 [Stylosanthes scabra]|uniref:Uncharacterized protein n=1 Tax=Stylosanthes scabra TaxID=79078 RepID=A0ABU6Q734_9FABA|nr:hypothetical protein [Stylosanthes scabra]
MRKKKSCQEVKVPRPLDAAETRLYGWVEEAVLTQPSVVESDALPEFRRNYPLMEDLGWRETMCQRPLDRLIVSPSGRELFTRLRMRLPFSDFQRDVMTRCRVAVSQLHLNGWGFILSFEKEFKWHYFKVLAASGKRAFWLNHENKPFSWVYWNPEVKDFVVYNLEPLEMAAFKFLVSLPSGLLKRNKFTCRFILDGSDAEVGKYLDDLLDVKMKRTKLDNLMAKMADPSMGPRAVLPTGGPSATATAAAATAASASTTAGISVSVATGSPRVESSTQVPAASTAFETVKAKKQSSKRERTKVVDLEEELKEDPAADLQR